MIAKHIVASLRADGRLEWRFVTRKTSSPKARSTEYLDAYFGAVPRDDVYDQCLANIAHLYTGAMAPWLGKGTRWKL